MSASSNPNHPDHTDLDRLHTAVKREKEDLPPQHLPVPLWVMFVCMVIAILAGGQLGAMTGGFSFNTSNPFDMAPGPDPRPHSAGEEAGGDPFQTAMKK